MDEDKKVDPIQPGGIATRVCRFSRGLRETRSAIQPCGVTVDASNAAAHSENRLKGLRPSSAS
jgi:hypothetical protein